MEEIEAPPPEGSADEARRLLAGTDAAAYYRSIAGLARASHGSLLQPLAYSPAYEFHQATCVVSEPSTDGIETVHLYGRAAYPEFDRQLIAAFKEPQYGHLLTDLYHGLCCEGRNVALVTNHGQIIDIALVLGALIVSLCDEDRRFGVLDERTDIDEIAMRSNLLVSRMVTTRQAFSLPTVQVLQSFCRSFFSVPQTASRRRAKLDPELARANNIVMREALTHQLDSGGQLLAMAASGSQDLSLAANLVQRVRSTWRQRRGEDPGDAPSLHLQPLYNGTIGLMLECGYALPLAISLDSAHPAVVIGGMTRVHDADDCHRVMEWIARAHQEATGVTTVYHRREDDLLTQVRAVLRS